MRLPLLNALLLETFDVPQSDLPKFRVGKEIMVVYNV